MSRHSSPIAAGSVVAFGILAAACGGSTDAPTPAPIPATTLTPIAVSPNNNMVVTQNNPVPGCSIPSNVNGAIAFGFQIQFQWTPPTLSDGVVGYEVFATKSDAPIPSLDAMVDGTSYTLTQCDSYVVTRNLSGWQWRVRGKDGEGRFTDWSPWATFQFGPCRLSDGSAC